MVAMTKAKVVAVNFRCPARMLKDVDELAANDHRDRTSMLQKMIAFYFDNNPPTNGAKPSAKKKAGTV
jgi:hypothetical protein